LSLPSHGEESREDSLSDGIELAYQQMLHDDAIEDSASFVLRNQSAVQLNGEAWEPEHGGSL